MNRGVALILLLTYATACGQRGNELDLDLRVDIEISSDSSNTDIDAETADEEVVDVAAGDTGRTAECGNAIVEDGEGCDDGNDVLTDACPSGPRGSCQPAYCGDGFTYVGVEVCDGPTSHAMCTEVCEISCDEGFQDCDPETPGCETNVLDDAVNCGACRFSCEDGRCERGLCGFTSMEVSAPGALGIGLVVTDTTFYLPVNYEPGFFWYAAGQYSAHEEEEMVLLPGWTLVADSQQATHFTVLNQVPNLHSWTWGTGNSGLRKAWVRLGQTVEEQIFGGDEVLIMSAPSDDGVYYIEKGSLEDTLMHIATLGAAPKRATSIVLEPNQYYRGLWATDAGEVFMVIDEPSRNQQLYQLVEAEMVRVSSDVDGDEVATAGRRDTEHFIRQTVIDGGFVLSFIELSPGSSDAIEAIQSPVQLSNVVFDGTGRVFASLGGEFEAAGIVMFSKDTRGVWVSRTILEPDVGYFVSDMTIDDGFIYVFDGPASAIRRMELPPDTAAP